MVIAQNPFVHNFLSFQSTTRSDGARIQRSAQLNTLLRPYRDVFDRITEQQVHPY